MIKRYQNFSFVFGLPGLLLQGAGNLMLASHPRPGLYLLEGGTVLLLAGFACYAMAKGRSPVWGLMAFLSCFGLIILALLEDRSNGIGAARPRPSSQVTTHARPFVIHNPVVGFLNLQGERGTAVLESDSRALSSLFSECRTSISEVPRCQVLFAYCDVDPTGRIANTTDSLGGLAKRAGAYIAIVANANGADAYKKALEARGDWNANLVLVLDRKGPAFSSFFRRLFEKMSSGTSMLTAWVELAPQIPGAEHEGMPASFMVAEAGHITFGR
jgi:hypothetical protein